MYILKVQNNQLRPVIIKYGQRKELHLMDYYVKTEDLEEIEFQENYPPILTARDVQSLLGIGKNKTYELLGNGDLKGFRIGRDWRITRESVYEYINKH